MPAYLASRWDLNTCTRFRAMIARRTLRMSSSLLPLNMTPAMTSIHPPAWWNGPLGPLTSARDLYGEDLRGSVSRPALDGERPACPSPARRGWGDVRRSGAPLCTLALEQIKGGGGELRRIELLEKRLEGNDLARRNTAIEHRPQLLSHRRLAIMRAAFRPGEIERREASGGQLPEPHDLSGSSQYDHLNRFCLSNPLKLCRRDWRLEKNHRVGGSAEIVLGYANVGIVIVVTERAESLSRALSSLRVTRHYDG